jgi:hypothetical protein
MDVIPLRPRRRRMRAWLAKRRLLPFLVGFGLAALAVDTPGWRRCSPRPEAKFVLGSAG